MANLEDFKDGSKPGLAKTKKPRLPQNGEGKDECCEEPRADRSLKRVQWSMVLPDEYLASGFTNRKLPSGVYGINKTNLGITFSLMPSHCDDLIDFPSSVFNQIIQEIDLFWTLEETFNNYGFLHRRGYLLYGPAGGGKTCLIQRIIQDFLEKDGIVFLCSNRPETITPGLKIFRDIEPNRPLVCLFEDIDALIDEYGEKSILSLLDGETQVDKVVSLATTNYPEKLDRRIIARPRRFDQVIKIGMPESEIRKIYFQHKIEKEGNDIDRWVELSEGFSFAFMAELVVLVKCLGNDLGVAAEKLKKLTVAKHKVDDGGPLGFSK